MGEKKPNSFDIWVILVRFQTSHDKINNPNNNRLMWVNEKMPRNTGSAVKDKWNKSVFIQPE